MLPQGEAGGRPVRWYVIHQRSRRRHECIGEVVSGLGRVVWLEHLAGREQRRRHRTMSGPAAASSDADGGANSSLTLGSRWR